MDPDRVKPQDIDNAPTVQDTHDDDDDETGLKTPETSHISCLCKPLPTGQFGRNLVVSIDGTANQFGLKNTNIVELYSRLVKDDTQLTYYNSGIGTYVPESRSFASFSQFISHQWDKAFASNFKSKILNAYEWLSENYRPGDRIFLFGFSRGAYQVRVIAGMIEKVGLLHKGNTQQIPFAYDLYTATLARGKRTDTDNELNSSKSLSHQGHEMATPPNVSKDPVPRTPEASNKSQTTHKNRSHPHVSFADKPEHESHAHSEKKSVKGGAKETPEDLCRQFKKSLSNDEVVVHFVGSWDTVSSVGILKGESLPETTTGMTHVCAFRHALALDERRVKFLPEYANGGAGPPAQDSCSTTASRVSMNDSESVVSHNPPDHNKSVNRRKGGNIKEVWFAGSHSDVGGGNVKNLNNNQFGPSLRWMTYEAILWGLHMKPFGQTWARLEPKSSMTLIWSIVENLPIKRLSYKSAHDLTRWPHRKQPRQVQLGQLIHESVFELIESTSGGSSQRPYHPKASLPGQAEWHKELLAGRNVVESDPYIQPNRILDAVKDVINNGDKHDPGYDRLFKLSLTAIGRRSIRERHDAENILAVALVYESRVEADRDPSETSARVHTIAKTLDRCFDIVPVEFLEDDICAPLPSAWVLLDRLYPEDSATRSKFLLRFADRDTRLNHVREEIDTYRHALQGHPQPPRHVRLDFIKKLVVGLLNSLVLTAPHIVQGDYKQWLHDMYKEAIRFPDLSYTRRSALIKSLASEINEHFEMGQPGYLDERILLFKNVFDLTPPEHVSRENYLLYLLPTLYQRFEETSQQDDIDEILSFNTEILGFLSVAHPHSSASTLAATLVSSYLARFKLTGQIYHIDEALVHLQESILNSASTDPHRANLYDVQGNWFHIRFKETGQLTYLDQADRSYRRALDIRRSFEPETTYPRNNEAAVLCDRFKLSRQRSCLDEAIKLYRRSLPMLSQHPQEWASASFNFADALLTLFIESGQQNVLEEAISSYEKALELNPYPRFPRAKCLNGLGVALRKHFETIGKNDDLSRAILLHEEALRLCPDPYLERDNCFNGLAAALASRFTSSQQRSDCDEAIKCYQSALKLLPSPHPSRANSLFGLATILRTSYVGTNQEEMLKQVILLYSEALGLLPFSHVDRADALFGLALALMTSYKHRRVGRVSRSSKAIEGTNELETLDDVSTSSSERTQIGFLLPFHPNRRMPITRRSLLFNQLGLIETLSTLSNTPLQPDESKNTSSLYGDASKITSRRAEKVASISGTAETLPSYSSGSSISQGPAAVLPTQSVTQISYAELDEAIVLLKESLVLRPFPHPARAESLRSLVDVMTTRFEHAENHDDFCKYHKELAEFESSNSANETATTSTVTAVCQSVPQ